MSITLIIKKKWKQFINSGFLFVLPWIIGFLVFIAGPMLFSLFISFFKWEYMRNMEFIGLANYIKVFTGDKHAMNGLFLTLKFVAFTVPLQLGLAILVASLLNTKLKGTNLVRTLVFVPVVLSGAVAGQMWKFMYNDDLGVFNYFLSFLNIKINWLTDSNIALYSVALTGIWAVGTPMILFLAGLKSIPKTYYESAEIDGAGVFQKFRHITLPLLTPTILYNLIQLLILNFQCIAPFMVITGGGPANSTKVYSLHEFQMAFKYLRMGYASAMSWVMFVLVLTTTLIIMKSSKFWVHYETDRG